MGLLIKRPNLLAFPGTRPGFDPSQWTGGNTAGRASSWVIRNGFPLNLITPSMSYSTPSGNLQTAPTDGAIGPTGQNNSSTYSQVVGLNASLGDDLSQTWAAIFKINVNSSFAVPLQNICSKGWSGIYYTGAGQLQNVYPQSFFNWGSVSLGVPYFTAYTRNMTALLAYSILVNLNNGQVQTTGGTIGPYTTFSDTSISMFDDPTALRPLQGRLAAAAYLPTFMTPQRLLQWAQDPWSFWYPQKFDFGTMLKAPAAGAFAAKFRKTLSPLGTRIGARQFQAA